MQGEAPDPVMKEFFVHELFVGRSRSWGDICVSVNKQIFKKYTKIHSRAEGPHTPRNHPGALTKDRDEGNEGRRIEQSLKSRRVETKYLPACKTA